MGPLNIKQLKIENKPRDGRTELPNGPHNQMQAITAPDGFNVSKQHVLPGHNFSPYGLPKFATAPAAGPATAAKHQARRNSPPTGAYILQPERRYGPASGSARPPPQRMRERVRIRQERPEPPPVRMD